MVQGYAATNQEGFANEVIEEHKRMKSARVRLRKVLEGCIKNPDCARRRDLMQAFQDFRERLIEHMEVEEREGFMLPLLDVRPELETQVGDLQKEHERLRLELNDSMAALDRQSEFTFPVTDVVLRIADLLDFIDLHERVENTLVLDTFLQETGSKD